MTGRGERGAAAVELVIIVPAIMLIVGALLAGWRVWSARTELVAMAGAAARAASLAESGRSAAAAAHEVLDLNLAGAQVRCRPHQVDVDTTGFRRPPGDPATVTVDVRCAVPLADLLVPGLPGTFDVAARGTQPLDSYRERRP